MFTGSGAYQKPRPSSIFLSRQVKAHPRHSRLGRGHQLAERIKNDLELPVVLLLKGVKGPGKFPVGREQPPQPNEGSNDLNARLDGTNAVEDVRGHNRPVLGERVRRHPASASACF